MREGHFAIAVNDEIAPSDALDDGARSDEIPTSFIGYVCEDGFLDGGVHVVTSAMARPGWLRKYLSGFVLSVYIVDRIELPANFGDEFVVEIYVREAC